jgi:hypothetical protein
MNDLRLKKTALTLLGFVAFGVGISAWAGDKIVLSEEKPQAEPNASVKGANDLFKAKSWKMDQPGFDYSILGIPTIPRNAPIGSDELRKRKAIAEQRKNFLFVDPGEIERKEEARKSFGVSTRPLDELDKRDDQKTDYTFDKVGEKKGHQPRQAGELSPIGQAASKEEQAEARILQQQQRERQDADDADSKREKVFSLNGSGEKQMGAHMSSELNFNNLFSPGKNDALITGSATKSDSGFTLKDAFAGAPQRSKEQQARMDDFNKMMNAPLSAGGFATAILPGTQPAASAPALPRSDEPKSSGNPLFNSALPSSASVPNNGFSTPGFPTVNNAPAAFPGSSPFQTRPASDTPRHWSLPQQELQRRKF